MRRQDFEDAIERFGTPLYIFDTDVAKETVLNYREQFMGRAKLCYAMKANSLITAHMAQWVDRIEVCSMGEFYICRELNIPADKILISGVLKAKEEIVEILEYYRGTCLYTAESLNQFFILLEWAQTHKEQIHVFLRLTSGNQFGMDESNIEDIFFLKDMYPYIKIRGIHYFSGTQKKSSQMIKKELEKLDELCLRLKDIEELEYGPGIAVSYFEGQKDHQNQDIQTICETLDTMKWKGTVTLEMGRALAASCGYYLTKVKDIKHNGSKHYCIVDGGIHQIHYDGQIRGIYHPKVQLLHTSENGDAYEWNICGSLCTVNDVLVQKILLKNLMLGSVLVFEKTGAYAMTEGIALFLSHELPKVVFYNKENGWKQVRDAQQTYIWNMERKK